MLEGSQGDGQEKEEHDPGSEAITSHSLSASYTPGMTTTRIVYDRDALLALKASPLSNMRPDDIAVIPGVTAPDDKGDADHQRLDDAPARRNSM